MNLPSLRQRLVALYRVFIVGVHNLFRNAWLTTAAIAIMVVTLTIVFFGSIAFKTLDDTIDDYSSLLTVSVYLNDEVSDSRRTQLESEINSLEAVDETFFTSKGQALRNFQDSFTDEQQVLDGLDVLEGNPLPASIDVTLNDITQYQAVLDLANDDEYEDAVSEAKFNSKKEDAFNTAIGLRKFFARASVIGGSVFGFISVLIIFNTIRMAIFTRSDEIEIMKLIGATPSYIRGPFLVEAALYGLIAAVVSLALTYSAIFALEPRLRGGVDIEATMAIVTDSWYLVFLAVVGVGVFIGLASSALATARYLRLKKW